MLGCVQVYFPRVIESANRCVKDDRALLLLLPNDVVHGVKQLRDTMSALGKRLI